MSLEGIPPEVLAVMPVQSPPTGVKSNFKDPETIAPAAMAVISAFLMIMIFTVGMRMYCRLVVVKRTGFDDWTCVLAGVFGVAVSAVALDMLIHGGFGPHSWNVLLLKFFTRRWNSDLFMLTLFTPIASGLAKISILLFIKRIFPGIVAPKTSLAAIIGIALNVLGYTAIMLTTFILCMPRVHQNGQLPLQCSAKTRMNIGIANAALNAALDPYVLAVATPSLWMLQIPTRKKIGILTVLAMGLIACVFSLISLYLRVHDDPMDDPCYKQVLPLIITILETLTAIISACLPALPALYTDLHSRVDSSIRKLLASYGRSANMSTTERSGYELTNEGGSTRSLNDQGSLLQTKVVESRATNKARDPYVLTATMSVTNDVERL